MAVNNNNNNNNNNDTATYCRGPMPSLSSVYKQMWPSKPGFTEKDVPDLQGKVYIVTGGSSGVGKEVVRILHSKNATVYIGARSEERAAQAIKEIQKTSSPTSQGTLHFLPMDFADLTTLPAAVKHFLSREKKLHVLFNNAAIQSASNSLKTTQGYEIHFGVNVLAPFLLTNLLTPTLQSTAQSNPSSSSEEDNDVRVVWTCSLSVELLGEAHTGISKSYLSYYPTISPLQRYGISKAASYLHATEFARLNPSITSIPVNPGHLASNLYREQPKFLQAVLNRTILYPAIYGAYTELAAGVDCRVKREDSGRWMIPWGKWGVIREDLGVAGRARGDQGGNGHAGEFWEWCLELVAAYL